MHKVSTLMHKSLPNAVKSCEVKSLKLKCDDQNNISTVYDPVNYLKQLYSPIACQNHFF